ncbi:MAG: hypothetical protein H0T78_02995, partial [Longispora sp.]|nr:hypothetical protein [Longispora sp. (in: high G+C Gram-positive bacteria)]
MLFDDVNTVDLKAKVSSAWVDFTSSLGILLPTLHPGTRLDLTLDPTATGTGDAVYEVTVISGGTNSDEPGTAESTEFTAYAVGNANLPEGYRLDRTAVADMIELGWSPPGVIEGSEGNFGLRFPLSDVSRIASLIARTMRGVYGAPHPAFLTYT